MRRLPVAGVVILLALLGQAPRRLADRQALPAEPATGLRFEVNRGQTDAAVRFLSRGRGYNLFLTPTEAVLSLRGAPGSASAASAPATLAMRLVGSNPAARVVGRDRLPGKSNYFIGNDPRKWRTDIPHYAKVHYQEAYPGIDLVFYGNEDGRLEYDFVVGPGADPAAIRLAFEGVDQLKVDPRGDLVAHLAVPGSRGAAADERVVRLKKPRIHQEARGRPQEIPGHFVLESSPAAPQGAQQVRFDVGPYDARAPLVIDPVLVYGTYLGGGGDTTFLPAGGESGASIAVDDLGSAYVTGSTSSASFPTLNPLPGFSGLYYVDAFVTKFSPDGRTVLYSTYLGGIEGDDSGFGIAVDDQGNAYVTGTAGAIDFPVTPGAFQPALTGESAFVTKLAPEGNALAYSTFLGGSGSDSGNAIAVDAAGSAYVTGSTDSGDFPTSPGALQPALAGDRDAFVAKLDAAGSALLYSTYLGGGSADDGRAVAIDTAGDAFLTGATRSSDFPTTPGAFDTTCGTDGLCNAFFDPSLGTRVEPSDAFVARLNPAGTALLYSTFLGGSSDDVPGGIAVDSLDNAYVAGSTASTDFPVAPGAFQPALRGDRDAFVTKLSVAGADLVYSTYLGGSSSDDGPRHRHRRRR